MIKVTVRLLITLQKKEVWGVSQANKHTQKKKGKGKRKKKREREEVKSSHVTWINQ
jgi:hypothetical protein